MKKQKLDKMKIAGLVGAAILVQPLAQFAGCGAYEPKYIPEVRATTPDGIPIYSAKEMAELKLEAEREDYARERQNFYELTVLSGDTRWGIAEEVYGFGNFEDDVLVHNNSDWAADAYPRLFAKHPELRKGYAFTDKSDERKMQPGIRLKVYFKDVEQAAAYAKKHPERKVESLGLRDFKKSLEAFFGKK